MQNTNNQNVVEVENYYQRKKKSIQKEWNNRFEEVIQIGEELGEESYKKALLPHINTIREKTGIKEEEIIELIQSIFYVEVTERLREILKGVATREYIKGLKDFEALGEYFSEEEIEELPESLRERVEDIEKYANTMSKVFVVDFFIESVLYFRIMSRYFMEKAESRVNQRRGMVSYNK